MDSLSRIYDYFYTSSDVKVFLTSSKGSTVNVDLITGVGYDFNVSSIPIYTLGSSIPSFFSKGNCLGQGMFVLPFKNEQYLKVMLQHVFEESSTIIPRRIATSVNDMSDEDFKALASAAGTKLGTEDNVISIGTISSSFDIVIFLDNSSPFYAASRGSIVLKDCKITGESLEVTSAQDQTIQQGYKFYFKNIERTGSI